MKFAFIDAEKASFPISRMCHALGVSQSSFLAWQKRPTCRRQRQDMVYGHFPAPLDVLSG